MTEDGGFEWWCFLHPNMGSGMMQLAWVLYLAGPVVSVDLPLSMLQNGMSLGPSSCYRN